MIREANVQQANVQQPNVQQPNIRQAKVQQAKVRQANVWWTNVRWTNVQQANYLEPGVGSFGCYICTLIRILANKGDVQTSTQTVVRSSDISLTCLVSGCLRKACVVVYTRWSRPG